MSEYPWQSPFGPHGPQVQNPSTTPNPTIPTPPQDFGSPSPWAPPDPSSPGVGGGGGAGGTGGGEAGGGAGGTGGAASAISDAPIGKRIRNLAIVGVVLGAFVGLMRGLLTHMPPSATGLLALRFGIAAALAGAGIPPAIRAIVLAARAAIWIALALVLWVVAIILMGQSGWLTRLR
ncbi:MAG TPA: hypothetical protein VF363_03685 [Candidatus Eisenbacteria bacterium]